MTPTIHRWFPTLRLRVNLEFVAQISLRRFLCDNHDHGDVFMCSAQFNLNIFMLQFVTEADDPFRLINLIAFRDDATFVKIHSFEEKNSNMQCRIWFRDKNLERNFIVLSKFTPFNFCFSFIASRNFFSRTQDSLDFLVDHDRTAFHVQLITFMLLSRIEKFQLHFKIPPHLVAIVKTTLSGDLFTLIECLRIAQLQSILTFFSPFRFHSDSRVDWRNFKNFKQKIHWWNKLRKPEKIVAG